MSMGKLLHRIATAPSADPRDDLRQLRDGFVRCTGRMAASDAERFAGLAEGLLARTPLIDRIAFARPLSASHFAPRPILARLAYDNHMVSAAILERSPLFDEEQIADILRVKGPSVKLAVAKRASLSVAVTDLVMEGANLAVCRALAANQTARISRKNLARLIDVAKDDDMTRAALGLRRDLPSALATALAAVGRGAAEFHPMLPGAPAATRHGDPGHGRAGFVITRQLITVQQSRNWPQRMLSCS